jgi:hypothetical protein
MAERPLGATPTVTFGAPAASRVVMGGGNPPLGKPWSKNTELKANTYFQGEAAEARPTNFVLFHFGADS